MDFRSTLFKIFIQSFFDYCSSLFIYLDNQVDKNRGARSVFLFLPNYFYFIFIFNFN